MKIFLLISLLAVSSYASFDGQWRGSGKLFDANGNEENCVMEIQIRHTPQIFQVMSSLFRCEHRRIRNRESIPLQIRAGQLYWGNRRLGSITPQALETQMRGPTGLLQTYDLKLRQGELIYEDHIEWGPHYITETKGRLRRVN